jgi:DNA-binding FrmR family transcriptional regulator
MPASEKPTHFRTHALQYAPARATPVTPRSGELISASLVCARPSFSIVRSSLQFGIEQYRVSPYIMSMSHTIKNKSKLVGRVRRIKGQIEAVERALEAELGCADVLMLVASVRGAVNGLTVELLEDHIRHHVVDPAREQNPEKAKGAADLIDVVRTYLK